MSEFFYPTKSKIKDLDYIPYTELHDLSFLGFDEGMLASLRIAHPDLLANLEAQLEEKRAGFDVLNQKARHTSSAISQ